MRVLVVLPNLGAGGAQRVALDLAKRLQGHSDHVSLCAAGSEGELRSEAGGLTLHSMESRLSLHAAFRFIRLLRRAIRLERPDVIVVHLLPLNLLVLALKRAKLVRVPVVAVEHSNRSASEAAMGRSRARRCFVRTLMRVFYPAASAVVGVSLGVAADLTRRLPRSTTVRSIENGIDVERVLTAASQGTDESAFAAGLGRPIVIAAGRLVPEKGFDDLLDAVALVSESRPREAMSLVILGDGPLHDSLREKARQLGIAGAVHFLGFVVNPWAVFAQADVFVLGSRYEGLGLVVAEAVACGLPVVATDCESGPADVLEGNPRSRLVPVGDASAMATAIEHLLDNDGGAPVELPHKFTLDGMADRYRQLLRDVVVPR